MYSNFFCTPRFYSSRARIPPRYSSRVITVASMIGSSICSIWLGSGILGVGDGVSDFGVGNGLDVGVEVSDFARGKLVGRRRLGRLVAEALHFEHLPIRPELDLLAHLQPPVDDAHQDDHTAIRV